MLFFITDLVITLWTERSKVRIPGGPRDFFFSETSRLFLRINEPPVIWEPWFFPGVRLPGY